MFIWRQSSLSINVWHSIKITINASYREKCSMKVLPCDTHFRMDVCNWNPAVNEEVKQTDVHWSERMTCRYSFSVLFCSSCSSKKGFPQFTLSSAVPVPIKIKMDPIYILNTVSQSYYANVKKRNVFCICIIWENCLRNDLPYDTLWWSSPVQSCPTFSSF